MGTRHEAREWALQFLFQSEFNRAESIDEGFKLFWEHRDEEVPAPPAAGMAAPASPETGARGSRVQAKARMFAEELARGVIAHHQEIDPLIAQYAENWEIERMGAVDRNAMRIAVFEMLYRNDIPPVVSINEAVDLAKAYSSIESGKFVNGILDRIRKGLDRPARDPNAPPAPIDGK
ncbi:MAG TPA: transcription antitermination factor NusB [Verrucomicrobia bacterium]|nr:transcription antitermination factor NusB [Verrucomicrobiota bacterium]